MSRKLISLLFSIAFITNSCAHQRGTRFESALKDGRCDEALENIPENDENIKFVGRANRAAGTALSYAATGAGYTADVVLIVVGGVLITAVVCAPLFLAVAASSSAGVNSNAGLSCFPVNLKEIPIPTLGEDTYKNTEEWRCPDLTALSRSVRKVASCHETKGTLEDKKNAQITLSSLNSNKKFMNCIVKSERDGIRLEASRLENEIALAR